MDDKIAEKDKYQRKEELIELAKNWVKVIKQIDVKINNSITK